MEAFELLEKFDIKLGTNERRIFLLGALSSIADMVTHGDEDVVKANIFIAIRKNEKAYAKKEATRRSNENEILESYK